MKKRVCILLSLGLLLVVASAVTAQSTGCRDAAGAPIPCPDRDGDGVQDTEDRCISDVGPATNNGCPESTQEQSGGSGGGDADSDGVADSSDQCATTAGTSDYAGCPGPSPTPIRDSDADGENDAIDRCINQPGPASNGGCPMEAAPVATIQPTERPIAPAFPESDVCLAIARLKTQNNLKQMALANAPVVGTMPEGEFVPVLSAVMNDQGERWFLTELGGYVLAAHVFTNDNCADLPTTEIKGTLVFPANEGPCQLTTTVSVGVNVRAEPSFNAMVVSSLVPGQFYAVLSAVMNLEGTWYRVEAGWVSASVVAIDGQCSLRIVTVAPSGFSIAQADYDQVEAGIFPDSDCFDLFDGIRYCQTVLKATADDDGSTEGLVPWNLTTCALGLGGVVCIVNEFAGFEPGECPPEFCEPENPNPYPGPDPNNPDSNGAVYCKTLLNDLALPGENGNPYYTVQNPDGSVGFGLRLPPLDPQTCLLNVYMVRQEGGTNGLLPIDHFVLEIDFPPPSTAYDAFMTLDGVKGESSADRPAKPSMTLFNVVRLDSNGSVCIPVTHGNFTTCPKPQ